MLQVTGFFKLD